MIHENGIGNLYETRFCFNCLLRSIELFGMSIIENIVADIIKIRAFMMKQNATMYLKFIIFYSLDLFEGIQLRLLGTDANYLGIQETIIHSQY